MTGDSSSTRHVRAYAFRARCRRAPVFRGPSWGRGHCGSMQRRAPVASASISRLPRGKTSCAVGGAPRGNHVRVTDWHTLKSTESLNPGASHASRRGWGGGGTAAAIPCLPRLPSPLAADQSCDLDAQNDRKADAAGSSGVLAAIRSSARIRVVNPSRASRRLRRTTPPVSWGFASTKGGKPAQGPVQEHISKTAHEQAKISSQTELVRTRI